MATRLRHSLLARLLVLCVAIAGCSIAATAWIASTSTSASIHHRYTANLADDSTILDRLVGFAATHRTWSGVAPTVATLARQTGREITLATSDDQLLASSVPGTARPPAGPPSAVVNPLAVSGPAANGGIDPRAVGPFALTAAERAQQRTIARKVLACIAALTVSPPPPAATRASGAAPGPPPAATSTAPTTATDDAAAELTTLPNGRVQLADALRKSGLMCGADKLDRATATELAASRQLIGLINTCVTAVHGIPLLAMPRAGTNDRHGIGGAAIVVDISDAYWQTDQIPRAEGVDPPLADCVDTARRQQLTPYVAPPAQLYISDSATTAAKAGISRAGLERIALAALAILLLTIAVCGYAATRLVRPLRALGAAAERVGAGDHSARVQPTGRGEIAELGSAFNRMAGELAGAEQRRKDMVSDVAHELRTPLGNIRGWLEAVQDGVAEPSPELVGSLLAESRQLQHIIEDLQDLALADAGRLTFHPETLDAATFVAQAVAAHRVTADERRIAITVDSPDTVEASTDPQRFRQILDNLISNAVRYTPPGGTVTVRARRAGRGVRIEVADTGTGISPEDLPNVFSRFWRAERSRGRQGGGSGLGLAITRHLVEAQGGTIAVRSALGAGSMFTVELPDAPPADPGDQGFSGG